jgi:hypothetical protein
MLLSEKIALEKVIAQDAGYCAKAFRFEQPKDGVHVLHLVVNDCSNPKQLRAEIAGLQKFVGPILGRSLYEGEFVINRNRAPQEIAR